jgi:hypothetical protein
MSPDILAPQPLPFVLQQRDQGRPHFFTRVKRKMCRLLPPFHPESPVFISLKLGLAGVMAGYYTNRERLSLTALAERESEVRQSTRRNTRWASTPPHTWSTLA